MNTYPSLGQFYDGRVLALPLAWGYTHFCWCMRGVWSVQFCVLRTCYVLMRVPSLLSNRNLSPQALLSPSRPSCPRKIAMQLFTALSAVPRRMLG